MIGPVGKIAPQSLEPLLDRKHRLTSALNTRFYRKSDLMMVFGGDRDPLSLRSRCDSHRESIL
ncbi:hypothetical protein [Chelativorans salis]|uniref:Uncharacterized protein n=1 Tax=Chelativorans salis TaxID=2978478 RepID=A0ABT2LR06_9HYPH|nr:hypothetical protein [Chelativorans sp. EGI FJ00035]MCT7376985.1 hypothetical protein [Chelativorans sp. EGI FJ00035]